MFSKWETSNTYKHTYTKYFSEGKNNYCGNTYIGGILFTMQCIIWQVCIITDIWVICKFLMSLLKMENGLLKNTDHESLLFSKIILCNGNWILNLYNWLLQTVIAH